MRAKRAYKLIKDGKAQPSILCPDVIQQGKLHPLIAFEYSRGPGLFRVGCPMRPWFKVDLYWLDETTQEVYQGLGFSTPSEEAALRYIEKQRERFKNGIPKRGRPKGEKIRDD